MGKKKQQEKQKEKQKKKLSQEEKKLLKAKKKEEKAVKEEKKAKKVKELKAEKSISIPEFQEEPAEQVQVPSENVTGQTYRTVSETIMIRDIKPVSETVTTEETKPASESGMSAEQALLVFRAMADETRMEILAILEQEELCASELLQRVSVVQSTLSHHMKVLTESGIVSCRKDYKRIYYSICIERMKEAAAFLLRYQQPQEK